MAQSSSRDLVLRWVGDVSKLVASTKDVNKAVDKSAKHAEDQGDKAGKGFGNNFSGGIKSVAGKLAVGMGALFAMDKIKDFAKGAYDEAREAQKVGAQTTAVIKSTGNASHVTTKSVADLASAISNKTGIDDETIQSGQNMLLTFKDIRNEAGKGNKIFDQTTQVMTDMSVATGQDMTKSAVMLGKALNDPTKGVSALSRVGVTFTDQQKEQIKALQDAGDTMGAQKIILKELRSEFGGSAAAQATAGEKLQTMWKNFQEEVGTALLPVIDKLFGLIMKVGIPALDGLMKPIMDLVPPIADLAAQLFPALIQIVQALMPVFIGLIKAIMPLVTGLLPPLVNLIKALMPIVAGLTPLITLLAEALGFVVGWVVKLVAIGVNLIAQFLTWITTTKSVHNAVMNLWSAIKDGARGVLDWFTSKFVPFFTKTLPKAFRSSIDWLKQNWPTILAIITGPIGLAVLAVVKHWDKIKKTFAGIKDWVASTWRKGWSGVSGWIGNAVGNGRDRVRDAMGKIRGRFADLKAWAGTTWRKGWASAKDWIAHPIANAREAVATQRDRIKQTLNALDDWGRHVFGPKRWSKIKDTITKPFSIAKDTIARIVGKKGIYKVLSDALDRLGGLWKKIGVPIRAAIAGMFRIINVGLLRNGINWLLGKLGVSKKSQVPWIKPNIPKLAGGGLLNGRGGRRDDKNLALLSNREYVQPVDSVDYYGVATMDRLRRRAIPKDLLVHGYAGGGLVGGSGRWTDDATAALRAASRRAGVNFAVFQRGFRPATPYSGTSHAKDAIDTGPVREAVWKALRDTGWAAWDRTGKGNWAPHIHAIPIPGKGVGVPGGSGVWQAADYLRGGDGLGGRDYHSYRPGVGKIGSVLAGIGSAIQSITDFIGGADPIAWLKNKVGGFARKAGIGGGAFGSGLAARLPGMIIDRARSWLMSKLGGAGATGTVGGVKGWNGEQLKNAATIISTARSLGFGDRGSQIGLITAMQESTLRNLNFGDRDSLGLFQQRAAWGSARDRTTPAMAARMFYLGGRGGQRGLKAFPWRSMGLAQAAQAVQVSAFPGAYAKWIGDAAAMIGKFKFDRGGRLPTGASLAYNGTGRSERVLSPAEERALGTTIVNIHVDGTLNDDRIIGRLVREIEAYERRRGPVSIRRAAA